MAKKNPEKENPELAEVRAILSKVQRLGDAPEQSSSAGGETASTKTPGRSSIGVFDRKRAVIEQAPQAQAPAAKGKLASILAGAIGAIAVPAVILLATGAIQLPGGYKALTPESEASLLTQAHRMISQGEIAGARNTLWQGGPERHADVAFALAQSYDPNYLQSLPKASASADASEAARWYRKWYDLAVQSGLEMDPGQLQRIINAMQRR
jgi:hypothetical protein